MDPIHVVDVMDPVLVTMNCMDVRKLRGMYHIIRKFPSTPNGWVGTRNRNWTLSQKSFRVQKNNYTITPPCDLTDCTDSYWTNLAGLERFYTAPPFHHQKTLSIHVFLLPKKILQIHATLGYFWDYKAGQKSRCQCRCQCQKATMSSQRPGTSSRKYGKKTQISKDFLKVVGMQHIPLNGGGMVIYRGRIRNLKKHNKNDNIPADFSLRII